ncbi:TRAP transporter small permease [uncultured Castellaniella sp.]|uniref:TRAP transporter small permease n=1 Tax=uncultured Castellaniella sp. TaxID=647907 RepID=UPI002637C538|nr:TRAP transporter small permease [uncultured Castellaniella sp.]
MSSQQPLKKLASWLDSIEYMAIILCCTGIVLLVFFGVLSRFIFHHSIAWSEELARYMFLWGALFGGSAACRNGQHGGIPLLVDKFPYLGQRFIETIVPFGCALFLGCMAWQSYRGAVQAFVSEQVSSTTEIPVWIVNGIVAFAFALATLRCIQGYLERAYRVDQIDIKE